MRGAKIIGTGSYVPDTVLTNKQLEAMVETTDQWIQERTGIKERRICIYENTSDLAVKAAVNTLNSCNIEAKDIDLIIVATVTPDGMIPSVACKVQKAIGAGKAMAFDISAACSGFLFALDIANKYISTGAYNNALIIGAEVLSKIVDWQDRNTCVLFGDGAGGVILTRSEKPCVLSINCKSEGEKGNALTCNNLPVNNVFKDNENVEKIKMNGKEIYKFAVRVMEEEFKRILREEKIDKENINFILPHQANIRMIESFSKKIQIPLPKFILNLDRFGNTSGASIPIALDEAVKGFKLTKGDNIIVIGFGGGLTYGSALIKWDI